MFEKYIVDFLGKSFESIFHLHLLFSAIQDGAKHLVQVYPPGFCPFPGAFKLFLNEFKLFPADVTWIVSHVFLPLSHAFLSIIA